MNPPCAWRIAWELTFNFTPADSGRAAESQLKNPFSAYTRWLHTGWPAGVVEKLPVVRADGTTSVAGLFIVGDLTGIPLLKFSLDSGARAVARIAADPSLRQGAAGTDLLELVIVGAGVSGMAAAVEARRLGLTFEVLEAGETFSTIVNFPRAKPIYTYPTDMRPEGALQVSAPVKESLLAELRAQTEAAGIRPRMARAERVTRASGALEVILADGETLRARRVIVAIGRSGNYRRLGCPGEELDKVSNRLHDPRDFQGKHALVVGGGDSALETALALADAGATVTLAHRGKEFSRPKPGNVERLEASPPGRLATRLETRVKSIAPGSATLSGPAGEKTFANDVVFSMIGREAPLEFFRRSGIAIRGEGTAWGWIAIGFFLATLALLYDWKSSGFLEGRLWSNVLWPGNMPEWLASWGAGWKSLIADRSSLFGTIAVSMKSRSFYYTFLYTSLVGWFGLQRVRRRNTPYVKWQTLSLFLVQAIPLFILPEIILPWLGYNGFFSHGAGQYIGDHLFESYISASDYAARNWPDWGHPRAYWRAYGLILAWPLNVYDVFTAKPMAWWLVIAFVQTFVLLPLAIYRWGKGVYCGWICSCGALAETMGDEHRTKMPHGPGWNRLNMIGQVFLAGAVALLGLRIASWILPQSGLGVLFDFLLEGKNAQHALVNPLSYKWVVDILFGGIIGVGFYFKYSGRVWCRFACPLAALMHIYARFSSFAIVPEKKKCISCNVCTSVCHQGIDVMNFANKGLPMQDPECVRCSACVQSCPTGVLQFGRVTRAGQLISLDSLSASPVVARETRNQAGTP